MLNTDTLTRIRAAQSEASANHGRWSAWGGRQGKTIELPYALIDAALKAIGEGTPFTPADMRTLNESVQDCRANNIKHLTCWSRAASGRYSIALATDDLESLAQALERRLDRELNAASKLGDEVDIPEELT